MPKPPAAPAIVITQSVQSHLPPHDLSLYSRAEAMPTPARRAAYQQPSDSSPIRIPPERCCHLWDSWNQLIMLLKLHRSTCCIYPRSAIVINGLAKRGVEVLIARSNISRTVRGDSRGERFLRKRL